MMFNTGTSNTVIEFVHENGVTEEILRCRHGHQHSGDRRIEDFLQCQCDHGEIVLGSDFGIDENFLLLCTTCGKSFDLVFELQNPHRDYSALIKHLQKLSEKNA